MGLAPEKASRIIVVLEDSHWTTTDPWSIVGVRTLAGALYSQWIWDQFRRKL